MPKRLSEKEIFKTKLFTIKDVVVQFGNNKVTRQILEKSDTVIIVPINSKGELILIEEYFTALDKSQLDLPGGRIDKDENIPKTANRELQEEVGYKALKIDKLGVVSMSPGYLTQKAHLFLARNLIPSKKIGDEDEELKVIAYPFKDFEALIKNNKITESRAIAALYMAKKFIENEKKRNKKK